MKRFITVVTRDGFVFEPEGEEDFEVILNGKTKMCCLNQKEVNKIKHFFWDDRTMRTHELLKVYDSIGFEFIGKSPIEFENPVARGLIKAKVTAEEYIFTKEDK